MEKFKRQIGDALQLREPDLRLQSTSIRAVFLRACNAPEPLPTLLALVEAAGEVGASNGQIKNPPAAWQSRANAILGGLK